MQVETQWEAGSLHLPSSAELATIVRRVAPGDELRRCSQISELPDIISSASLISGRLVEG